MNYFVPVLGHLAWFEQYEAAREFAKDFGGHVHNYWGFASIPRKYPNHHRPYAGTGYDD
jgi:hypothetical protein